MKWDNDFSVNYERIYRDVFTENETALHSKYISSYIPTNGSVLDIPCGAGRVSIALAKLGFFVHGVDLYNIPQAELNASAYPDLKSFLSFETGDMRTYVPKGNKKFDVAVSLFSSFGYFTHKENVTTLQRLIGTVKSEGVIIIDVSNPVKTFLKMSETDWRFEIPNHKYNGKSSLDPTTAIQTFSYAIDGRVVEAQMRHYFLQEFADLLATESCVIKETHGSFEKEPYNPKLSNRLIIVAKKQ